jgi:threonylcarbamoyladenosine tRNA methylthiotransferase MtaB
MSSEAAERSEIRVGFLTVGCRANQADTSRMISLLPPSARETDVRSAPCDLIVINTCAVTSRAEADARKLIRRAHRAHPDAKIIVAGCATQVDPDKWRSMPEVSAVIGVAARDRIAEIILDLRRADRAGMEPPGGGIDGPTPLAGHRSRPFLKIQDGCSRGCAYCIVPTARGPERSRPLEFVREDISALSSAGFREIVLTGIHLGRWGRDLGRDLNHLLDLLGSVTADVRFRLSSLEPMDLTPELVRRILSTPKTCPHLHIPLQSGDQRILDAMGRGHTLAHFAGLIRAAVDTVPDVGLGTDVMAGFPGENINSHQNTLDFINDLPLTYLHVFTFSPRAGTPAARMPDRPSGQAAHDRMKDLRALDAAKRLAFRRTQHGKVRECLIESPPYPQGSPTALSDNFLRIAVRADSASGLVGHLVQLPIDINDTCSGREAD